MLIASGKQKTMTLSPACICISPKDINAFSFLIIPPKTASLGKRSLLMGCSVTFAFGNTSNSKTSASMLCKFANARISPFRMCLKILLAAISFC